MRTHYWLRAGAGMLALMLAVGLAGPGLTYAQEGEQPYVGIQIENTAAGARVLDVLDESPAAAAGLQVDDLITALDGEAVTLEMTLAALVLAHAPGDVVTFTIERDGESSEVEVTLGTAPQVVEVLPPAADDEGAVPPLWGEGSHFGQSQTIIGEARGYLGVSFLTLTPEVIATLDEAPPVEEGALIMDVQEDTPAAEAGLEAGDVVTAVNGEPVDAERTLSDRIYAYEADDVITLTVVRGDEELTLEVTLAPLPAGMGFGPGITIQGMPLDAMPGQGLVIPYGSGRDGRDGDQDGNYYFEGPNFFFITPDGVVPFGEMFGEMFGEHMDQMPEGMPFGNGMGPFGMFGQEFLEQHPEFEGLLGELQQGLSNPDFDWEAFLAEHPELGEFLNQIGPNFDWQQWLELLPDFPWFGQFDPFHQDVEPVTPEAESNSAT